MHYVILKNLSRRGLPAQVSQSSGIDYAPSVETERKHRHCRVSPGCPRAQGCKRCDRERATRKVCRSNSSYSAPRLRHSHDKKYRLESVEWEVSEVLLYLPWTRRAALSETCDEDCPLRKTGRQPVVRASGECRRLSSSFTGQPRSPRQLNPTFPRAGCDSGAVQDANGPTPSDIGHL